VIDSKAFSKYPTDWDDDGVAYFLADLPNKSVGIIGSVYNSIFPEDSFFSQFDVLWLSTKRHRRPSDAWLAKHFPSLDELIAGFKEAFGQYRTKGCGEEMHAEMLKKLTGKKREAFQRDAWLPFISITEIRINPDAWAISFRCNSADEEFNLHEHGVNIVVSQDGWKFGYAGDDYENFAGWSGPLPSYKMNFALQRVWYHLTGRRVRTRDLFGGGNIEITFPGAAETVILRGKP